MLAFLPPQVTRKTRAVNDNRGGTLVQADDKGNPLNLGGSVGGGGGGIQGLAAGVGEAHRAAAGQGRLRAPAGSSDSARAAAPAGWYTQSGGGDSSDDDELSASHRAFSLQEHTCVRLPGRALLVSSSSRVFVRC